MFAITEVCSISGRLPAYPAKGRVWDALGSSSQGPSWAHLQFSVPSSGAPQPIKVPARGHFHFMQTAWATILSSPHLCQDPLYPDQLSPNPPRKDQNMNVLCFMSFTVPITATQL